MGADASIDSAPPTWTFLTNHAHVLLAVDEAPDLRLREIAELVGVTERTAMQIVIDLEAVPAPSHGSNVVTSGTPAESAAVVGRKRASRQPTGTA